MFHLDVDDARILKEFNFLRNAKGYDLDMKHDMESVLRFLYQNGKRGRLSTSFSGTSV